MRLLQLGLLLFCVAATGCGSGISGQPVTGTVTLDGVAIEGASITFQPKEGGTGMPAVGTTDANGVYTLTDMRDENVGAGAVEGDYNVGVLWFKPSGKDLSQATGESEGEESGMDDDKKSRSGISGPDSLLPTEYQNPKTSGLEYTVVSGENTFDISLDSKFKP
ncbi:MAG: hypothetical protein Aurels2KO_42380 [Aureliella sp.]